MEENIQTKEKSKKPLILFLIIVTIISFTAIGFLGYLYAKEMSAQGKNVFDINSVDPAIANKLTGSIVYSSDKSDSASYFSPGLEITLKYSQKLFTLSEGSDTVFIYPVDWELFSSGYLKIAPTTDIKGLLLSEAMFSNLKVVEEKLDTGIGVILFSYDEKSFIDESKIATKNLSVIYKKISDQNTAYIEIRDFNINEEEEVLNGIKEILNSISTDISEIDENIKAEISSGILGIEFNRSEWSISYQSEYSLSLTGVQENKGSVSIYVSDVYDLNKVKDSTAIRDQLSEALDIKKKYFEDNNYEFNIIEEASTVTFDGVSFEKVTVEYNYGYDPSTIETIYIGFLDGKEKQVDISTRYYSDNTTDKGKIESLLKSLNLDNEDIYSMNGSNVLGSSSVTVNKATVLGQASTVRILSRECDRVSFSNDLRGFNIAGKSYTLCTLGTGSGFVVDGNGHIVTNAHVADPNDLDVIIEGWTNDGSFENDFDRDIATIIVAEYGSAALSNVTEEIYYYFKTLLLSTILEEDYMTITNQSNDLYVQGNNIFNINSTSGAFLNPEDHFEATLINSNKISSTFVAAFSEETTATEISDLALIKTNQEIFYPSIPIITEGFVAGQSVYVIGYPGVAENEELVSNNVVLSSTVTQGTISAIKPSSQNTFDLIQIDASVQHGNSGGPIIDEDGNVIGVATYGMGSESGNYNMGISGKELQRFLDSSSIETGINSERKQLESALADISLSYYSRAKDKIQEVLGNQSSLNVVLQPFVDLCDAKIAKGEDKSPIININASLPMLIIFVILILMLVIAVSLLVVNLRILSKRTKTPAQIPNLTT